MEFALNLPVGSVSFGQISYCLLQEIWARNLNVCFFPISNQIDLGCQKPTQEFVNWLQEAVNRAHSKHSRKNPVFKLWHLNQSLESFSEDQYLLSFYELDSPTPQEINTVRNNKKVFFTSTETVNLYKSLGCDNVYHLPLGFDKHNFKVLDKKYFDDGRISFNLFGKYEFQRKRHNKVIESWIKRFGNDRKYFLNMAIYSPFIQPEAQSQMIGQCINEASKGQKIWNLQLLNYMKTNAEVNDYINSGSIVIGMGTENWGMGEFTHVACGKNAVLLNANGFRNWATKDNAVLINPNGKIDATDGIHFHKSTPYNVGNIYDFDSDEFISGCEEAIKRYENNPVNVEGLRLQEKFKYSDTVDAILKHIET